MSGLKFVVFLGSVRDTRVGERIKKLFMNNATKFQEKGYSFQVIDAKEVDLPVVKTPMHFYRDQSQVPEALKKVNDIIAQADGYFLLTAEYNRLPCPGLINLLDHFPPKSYAYKSCGVVGYSMGPYGGAFAASSLANFIAELNVVPCRNTVLIPVAHQDVTEEGKTENERLKGSIDKLIRQVAWWAEACKAKRETDGPPDLS